MLYGDVTGDWQLLVCNLFKNYHFTKLVVPPVTKISFILVPQKLSSNLQQILVAEGKRCGETSDPAKLPWP